MNTSTLLVLIGVSLLASSASAKIVLVRDGQPACTIVIAPDASEREKAGATDLQLYLGKMSGAKVPIGTDTSVTGNRILIGVSGHPPVDAWKGDRPGRDAFAIETRPRKGGGTDLFLVGGDQRGAEYAVYELLERFLDVRWYMPCDVGEDVPEHKTIQLGALKWRNRPDYEAIGGLIWSGGPGADDWLRRNKGDVGSPGYFFGHNWHNVITSNEENKKAHPEWFALQPDGTRSNQLCTSNPDVIRISIEKAREYFEKNPEAMLFSLSPNDELNFCTCPACKAVDAQYGVTDASQTDRFVHYANTVLKELKKTHPDKLVGILAYVTHTRPPVSAVPDANYATIICHTPWEFCHVHPINDPKCVPNTRFRKMIEGWTKVCKHVSSYDYYGHYYVFGPWPILHDIRKDVPYLRSIGVTGFMVEAQQHWANQGINFYLAAKLVWDTDRDSGKLLDEYYHRFYGPAEKPMRQYWEMWEAAMATQACAGNGWAAIFTPERMDQAGKLLDEAERLAKGNDKVTKRLALNRIGYRFTQAYARMQQYAQAKEFDKADAAGEEAIKIAEENQGTQPQAFVWWLVRDQTRYQMAEYKK